MFDSCLINYVEEYIKDNCSGFLEKQICGWLKRIFFGKFVLLALVVIL